MSGLTFEEASHWRKNIIFNLKNYKDIKCYDPTINVNFDKFNEYLPNEYIHKNIYFLKKSDIVIVKLSNKHSIGTYQEIFLAQHLGKPIIAIVDSDCDYAHHPYLEFCISKYCKNEEEACAYLIENYYETVE